ncbi:phosphopyruvate hydratase [Candidatus Falkowbacteria bacterium]|nr:phosphopyruvate hydratase [Candidatus Falkowbacteria bacterium]
MLSKKIQKIVAREILDSRGNPTIETRVTLSNHVTAVASVPSGASTGVHEALELRDGGKRYGGKGVLKAVEHVNKEINHLLHGIEVSDQQDIDKLMLHLDGTDNKSRLGANAILSVSLAAARAGSVAYNLPLYRYLRKIYKIHYADFMLPRPMMNILNGGAHANWGLDIQECMIVPKAKSIAKNVEIGTGVFHALGKLLSDKQLPTGKGDEGGYAVPFAKNSQAFDLIISAVKKAGFVYGKDVELALDVASSEFFEKGKYKMRHPKTSLSSQQMINQLVAWKKKYKLLSIEDGVAEDDWNGWKQLTHKLGDTTMLVGDDLFVTDVSRLTKGIDSGVANAILIKLNQIGSLTETIATINKAKQHGYNVIISHRSGETADTFIADLAVAVNAEFIKTGSLSRSERVEKYNRLMEISENLK